MDITDDLGQIALHVSFYNLLGEVPPDRLISTIVLDLDVQVK